MEATEYPPETPTLLQVTTTKVVMIVDTVSPTPFALLRRAKNFEYRDDHWHLQEFANYEDPIRALTDECLRVLKCISSTNESSVSSSKHSTSLRDASWSRFEDIGFGGSIESDPEDGENQPPAAKSESAGGLRTAPHSQGGDMGRPTTPSWADFMSSGFSDEANLKEPVGPLLLPPDKVLPPIAATRGQSSQSHKRMMDSDQSLEPAELASISTLDLDDSFWWVWITSLSGDEPLSRKAVFGRCALLETVIRGTKWLVLEEQVKGAAPEPEAGAQIVEKKRFFSFGSRKGGKLSRRKSSAKKVASVEESYKRPNNQAPQSKTSIGPDQHKRIQAAAAALQKKHREQEAEAKEARANNGDETHPSSKTNSVLTLQPAIVNEASSAMKWASNYDKNAFRAAYLGNSRAGTGAATDSNGESTPEPAVEKPVTPAPLPPSTTKTGPAPPPKDTAMATPLPPSPEPPKRKPVKEAAPEEPKETKAVVVEQPVAASPEPPAEEAAKKLKKRTGNTGFKGMFTTNKKKGEQPPMKSTGAKENSSSVAAARAALEAKAKEAQDSGSRSSPKPAQLKKKPVPEKPATPETPKSAPAPAPAPAPEPEKPSPPQQPAEPVLEQEAVAGSPESHGPPQTRRGVEYDALSRVDTNERNAADQEFSKFDQGPLVDQPAFVPDEEPVSPIEAAPEPEQPQSPANGHEENPKVSQESGIADAQDRWAQIRKNAAERSAVANEEPETRTSQSERTDEGDTSGEESKLHVIPGEAVTNIAPAIESRVARIKARVAELTGNREGGGH